MQLIKRADHNLYDTTAPIELADRAKLLRYQNNVGLNIDSWVIVQKNYASEIVPFKEFIEAQKVLDKNYPMFQYELVSYNKSLKKIKFEDCPHFDTRENPEIARYVIYDLKTKNIEFIEPDTTQMLLDKWLLVKDDYTGFNVQESYERSKEKYENI